ncbi:MAG: ATP-binding protein [Elusimicrobiota bacterium]
MRFSYRFELSIVLTSIIWVSFAFGSFLTYRSLQYETLSHHSDNRVNFINVLKEASDWIDPEIHRQLATEPPGELANNKNYKKYTENLKKLQLANQNIRVVYTAVKNNDDLKYVLKTSTEDIVLDKFDGRLEKAFRGNEVMDYGEDKEIITAYVPLVSGENEQVLGVLGGVLKFSPVINSSPPVTRNLILFFLLFSVPFSILVGTVVSGWVTGPIKHLTYVAKKIGEGNYKVKAQVNRSDEVGILAQVLNRVRKKLDSFQKEMELKVKERTNSLKAMFKEAVSAREKNRIVTELHDTLGQIFASLNVKLDLTLKLIDDNNDKVVEQLKEMQKITGRGTDLARRIISNLDSSLKEGHELEQVLNKFLNKFTSDTPISYKLNVRVSSTLPIVCRTAVYHIVTEATNNMGKHSQATEFEVSIEESDNKIKINIEDNGCGFDRDKVLKNLKNNRKYGLRSMRKKAKELGGTFKVFASVGEGCRIQITLPLKK